MKPNRAGLLSPDDARPDSTISRQDTAASPRSSWQTQANLVDQHVLDVDLRTPSQFTTSNSPTLNAHERSSPGLDLTSAFAADPPDDFERNLAISAVEVQRVDTLDPSGEDAVNSHPTPASNSATQHLRVSEAAASALTEAVLYENPEVGNPTEVQDQLTAVPSQGEQGLSLHEMLSKAQHETPSSSGFFVPDDDLRRLINPESVLREMSRCRIRSAIGLSKETTAQRISATAPRLFATLVFENNQKAISDLLDEGVDDSDLPFSIRDKTHLCSARPPFQTINCAAVWESGLIRHVAQTQWYMLAPIFEFTDNIKHYELDQQCMLPLIESHEFDKFGNSVATGQGGFGYVWKTAIHPAHQRVIRSRHSGRKTAAQATSEIDESDAMYPFTAVKCLNSKDENSFKSEVDILKRFRMHPHEHLVKLLATYRLNGKYHMIFPYADSNLRQYWRKNALPEFSYENVSWTLQQCKAIGSALHLIHTQSYTSISSGSSQNPNEPRMYTRHGDIKPENILWYAKPPPSKGRLVITDFGLTDCHQRDSRSAIPPGSIGGSPTYEPPEVELKLKVSRAYDIWTLGCVYLEFITWLLCGSDTLEKFPDARITITQDEPNMTDDKFYRIVPVLVDGSWSQKAIVRESVQEWISRLHEMPRCSKWVHDFLNLISDRMLVTEPGSRIRIAQLNVELHDMIMKAENCSYLLDGLPNPARQPPHHFLNSLPLSIVSSGGTSNTASRTSSHDKISTE